MHIVHDKSIIRLYFFAALLIGSFNFFGQSISFSYVQGYFGVTSADATWLLRGFQSGTIITSIAGLVFIKWIGHRNLFIGSSLLLLAATIISFTANSFNILLVSRIAAGLANGFVIAVSTQMFLSTYEGKMKVIGAINSVAANIGGLCIGLFCNGIFTEDYGWQFTYYLSIPAVFVLIICSFFMIPSANKQLEVEDDWLSLVPFSILIVAVFFIVLFREQYQGISNLKFLFTCILAVLSACFLLIRGAVHKHPLFDTRLLQYPGFVFALVISYLSGAAFVFNIAMLGKLLGGILQMPMADVFHFINFLSLVIFITLIVTLVLIAKKFDPFWLLISGLLAVAYAAYNLSKLNPEFSFDNVLNPSLVGAAGSGVIALAVILLATKSVPQQLVSKVANFRSVAFTMGIAITATGLGRTLNLERVRNFNLMTAYTDPGNPLVQERINGLQAFYQSNGYDANDAYQAAINGLTGMVKLQSVFLGMSEILFMGYVISLSLAAVVLVLWIVRNHRMLINFFTLNRKADERLQPDTAKT
jgi:DHA2 family multidrug resistance protein